VDASTRHTWTLPREVTKFHTHLRPVTLWCQVCSYRRQFEPPTIQPQATACGRDSTTKLDLAPQKGYWTR